VPYSGNFEAPYLKIFYNALFFNGSAKATLDLVTTPVRVPRGITSTLTVSLTNIGGSAATNPTNVRVLLDPGLVYSDTIVGPAPTSVTVYPTGTLVYWASLPDIPGESAGVIVRARWNPSSSGDNVKFVTFKANYADTAGEGFGRGRVPFARCVPGPDCSHQQGPPTQGPVAPNQEISWT